jgi:hypothetical protein
MDANPISQWFSPGIVASFLALGAVLSMWRQALGFLKQSANYVVGRADLKYDAAAIVLGYLCNQVRVGRFRSICVGENQAYSIRNGRSEHVLFEEFLGSTFLALYRWRPVLVHRADGGNNGPDKITLLWVRGTLNARELIAAATRWTNDREHESGHGQRFAVIRVSGAGGMMGRMGSANTQNNQGLPAGSPSNYAVRNFRNGTWDPISHALADLGVDAASGKPPMEVYSFDGKVLEAIEEARTWHKSGGWYRERGLPWTLGWLLTGPPGTGKSSLARAVAQDLDLPVFVFDLASMSNAEFVREWRSATTSAPCMVVFEDIDGVFDGRDNKLGENGGGLTFDCLLNCLSGVEHSDGVFTVFTTNHPERIDPAIAQFAEGGQVTTRPGRVDRIIELGEMSRECRMRHARRLLADLLPAGDIAKLVVDTDGMTAAQFADRCTTMARKHAPWMGRHIPGPVLRFAAIEVKQPVASAPDPR